MTERPNPFELPPDRERWWYLAAQATALSLVVLCGRVLPGPYGGIVLAAVAAVAAGGLVWLLLRPRRDRRRPCPGPGMNRMIRRIEASRAWLFGRILIPDRYRSAACAAAGAHRPELVDLGRHKVCYSCGAW